MRHENDCGCGRHGEGHGEQYEERHEERGGDCGCGGHGGRMGHHGMSGERRHHGGCCCCCCRHHHGSGGMMGMGFGRRFISREEIAARLEEYLKQLQAEAKAVEERLAELKKSQET